jgi:hypothetical protein
MEREKVPLPPCRWNLPSGSVAFPPLVLLRTCFTVLQKSVNISTCRYWQARIDKTPGN